MESKIILTNILKNKFFRTVFIVITLLLLIIPTISYQKVSNAFKNEIFLNIENDANKIAKHIYSQHFNNNLNRSLKDSMSNIVDDFDIYKIKFFDANGIVVNSTKITEIGTKNKNSYFYDVVAKGEIYYSLVQKGRLSLENKIVTKDVVEIYIPIMKNNTFQGSFELYYDVTEKISSFNSLTNNIKFSQTLLTMVIFIIFMLILYYGSKSEIKQKLIEKELIIEKAKADDANEAKTVFFASMSHELRTPLNSIIGFNELLLKAEENKDKQNKLKIVNTSSKMLLQLINDVLDFSKIESDKVELNNESFNLHDEIKEICDVFTFQIKEKNLNFSLNIDKSVPVCIEIDPLRVKQIIMNLLSNAIKFTDSGKNVSVNVSYEKNKSEIRLEVIDQGIGISKEKHTLVFEKFSQADNTITKRFGGTGLGLAISKSLSNMMGGDIILASEEGKGSNFTLLIPANIIEVEKTEIQENTSQSDFSNFKALLVEDNEVNQLVFTEIVKGYNLEVQIAHNGSDALEIYKENQFDIIFMDDKMPIMGGEETIRNIQKLDTNHPPIIAFTANTSQEDKDKFYNAGVVGFLAKPFKNDELLNILKTFLLKS